MNPFPVIRSSTPHPTIFPWNLHRIALDRLPALHQNFKGRSDGLGSWFNTHLGGQLSLRERGLRERNAQSDTFALIKDTVHALFTRVTGTQGGAPSRVFSLYDETTKSADTIIFISALRFDISSHTIVCDAFVLTLCSSIMSEILPWLQAVGHAGVEHIRVYADEMQAWKRLLPALAERCRTWKHTANCEYVTQGCAPLNLEVANGDPLCSCGRGKNVDDMLKVKLWKKLSPFVTRIAISPLFAVSYAEPVWDEAMLRTSFQSMLSTYKDTSAREGPASEDLPRTCGKCHRRGEIAELRRCSGCKRISYCSEACQKEHWKEHKPRCKAAR